MHRMHPKNHEKQLREEISRLGALPTSHPAVDFGTGSFHCDLFPVSQTPENLRPCERENHSGTQTHGT